MNNKSKTHKKMKKLLIGLLTLTLLIGIIELCYLKAAYETVKQQSEIIITQQEIIHQNYLKQLNNNYNN
jgi:hypothetical protein